jgi:hypothetical protein
VYQVSRDAGAARRLRDLLQPVRPHRQRGPAAAQPAGADQQQPLDELHHDAALPAEGRLPANFLDPAQLEYRRIRLRAADQDASKTTMHQFSVGAQKVFAGSYVLSLDLVGVEGRHLANLINLKPA